MSLELRHRLADVEELAVHRGYQQVDAMGLAEAEERRHQATRVASGNQVPTPLLDPIQSGRERVDVCGVKLGSAVEVMEEHHGSCAARTGD